MAFSVPNSYPFIVSPDNGDVASNIEIENDGEPLSHTDDDNDRLVTQVRYKIHTIAITEAEKGDLHQDTVYGRFSPIDGLIFGRSGIGKSCPLKAITDDPTIQVSAISRPVGLIVELERDINETKLSN